MSSFLMAAAMREVFFDTAFDEVGDENEDGVGGVGDEGLAVANGFIDVGATTELGAKEEFDGVVAFFGEIDHGGVEDDELGLYRRQRSHDGAEDARIDDAGGHGSALVDAEDDVAAGFYAPCGRSR